MIESKTTTVDGRTLRALIDLASSLSGEPDGDPRPALIGAVAAASLLAADVEITGETLAPVATAISRTAAVEAEKLLPVDERDQVPVADVTA